MFNRTINHVAISCTDLEGLVSWYTRHLGFQLIGKINHFNRRDHLEAFEKVFTSYPDTLRELKFAILTSGNGVGIEVFQFIDPAPKPHDVEFDFKRAGFFHICVTDPDPAALVKKLVGEGGKQIGDWMDYRYFGHDGHKGVYTRDPWGNVIEIMSISIERVSSAGEAMTWVAEQTTSKEEA